MEKLKKKVLKVVRSRFSDAEVELEEVALLEKLSGHVVTGTFTGKSQRERSRMLRELLSQHLTAREQQMLCAILTFSPAECRAIVKFG